MRAVRSGIRQGRSGRLAVPPLRGWHFCSRGGEHALPRVRGGDVCAIAWRRAVCGLHAWDGFKSRRCFMFLVPTR